MAPAPSLQSKKSTGRTQQAATRKPTAKEKRLAAEEANARAAAPVKEAYSPEFIECLLEGRRQEKGHQEELERDAERLRKEADEELQRKLRPPYNYRVYAMLRDVNSNLKTPPWSGMISQFLKGREV